ncbi:MAG: glutamate-5-semialdehyde dehydrogenase [Candidatus Methanomethylophilaceae archaeon]|nr:glutamate-5-semialdehyde dehydrogenase [Candidatus Methanomethylophilaceae archaeon]
MNSTIKDRVRKAKEASIALAAQSTDVKQKALAAMAEALDANRARIFAANSQDMQAAEEMVKRGEMTSALAKRLKVDDGKIDGMIAGIRDVMSLPDPVGRTLDALELDSGLMLYQVSCPIGLIGVIFESRPDVVPQILSLCLKSGNATVFKGGSEAQNSNRALFQVLVEAAGSITGIPPDAFQLMESRDDVNAILEFDEYIDLLIPRGSNSFVRFIQDHTRIPVLGHAAGICHVYVDEHADPAKASGLVLDSKIQYAAVCNAAETLLVHQKAAADLLPSLVRDLMDASVEVRVDEASAAILASKGVKGWKAASDEDWDTEYNDMIISVKVVEDVDEAIRHINRHGSGHTDSIITEDRGIAARFISLVDSSSVMVNASTRFSDGYRYGKGAEVGISTNKIHARGPVGMEGLMIYKYVLLGEGHVVKDYAGAGAKAFTHVRKDETFQI